VTHTRSGAVHAALSAVGRWRRCNAPKGLSHAFGGACSTSSARVTGCGGTSWHTPMRMRALCMRSRVGGTLCISADLPSTCDKTGRRRQTDRQTDRRTDTQANKQHREHISQLRPHHRGVSCRVMLPGCRQRRTPPLHAAHRARDSVPAPLKKKARAWQQIARWRYHTHARMALAMPLSSGLTQAQATAHHTSSKTAAGTIATCATHAACSTPLRSRAQHCAALRCVRQCCLHPRYPCSKEAGSRAAHFFSRPGSLLMILPCRQHEHGHAILEVNPQRPQPAGEQSASQQHAAAQPRACTRLP
jgi:hypothetical protein